MRRRADRFVPEADEVRDERSICLRQLDQGRVEMVSVRERGHAGGLGEGADAPRRLHAGQGLDPPG